jgi:hypothetical protein
MVSHQHTDRRGCRASKPTRIKKKHSLALASSCDTRREELGKINFFSRRMVAKQINLISVWQKYILIYPYHKQHADCFCEQKSEVEEMNFIKSMDSICRYYISQSSKIKEEGFNAQEFGSKKRKGFDEGGADLIVDLEEGETLSSS